MTLLVPYGYQGKNETLEQTRAKHQHKYHPEAWRRIEAVIIASDGLLGLNDDQSLCGVGGGARTREEQAAAYARDPNTFAPVDSSFHQGMEWASKLIGAQAIDWVGAFGRHDEAWKWLRDNGGLYGIKTFWNVNGEPWHSQCIEIANSVSQWKRDGRPDPGTWVFPGQLPPPPTGDYGLWPLNPNKPEILEGSLGDAVRYLQRVCNDKAGQALSVDGEFGPATREAVTNLQTFFGLIPIDGRVNKNEWDLVDALVGVHHSAPPPVVPPTVPVITADGLYWVMPGDSPYGTEAKVYGGSGANWAQHFTVEQFSKANYQIPLPGLPGVIGPVVAGEGAYQTIKRLYPTENPYAAGRLERFYELNGGPHRVLHPGELVFLDVP